ncbi:MAG: GNAT family N-acetyltransferase [Devosia sp.]
MLAVRRANVADIAAMSAVMTASITELCAADHQNDPEKLAAWTRNKTPEGIQAMLSNPEGRMFVAELDGAVVAVGAVSNGGEITLNYVAPLARFRGVSKAMLAALESELKRLGFSEARLEATATARRFYQAAGWLADGPQMEGRMVNGHPMRKRL